MKKSTNFRILGLFAFVILSWGLGWPANKIGLSYMPPLWYTATRLIVGTATMMVLVLALKKFTWPKREDWPLILIIGLLQISIYMLLANVGLSHLPAGRSSILGYTTPLWVMPATALFFQEETSLLSWWGFLLGVTGLMILLSPWQLDWANKEVLFGAGMLLLASFGWAISILCARYMHWSKSPLELAPWQLLVGTVPIVILAWVKEPTVTVHWDTPLLLTLVYTGILVTGLSYWVGVIVNKELPALTVSLGFLLVPVCSLLASVGFMHESLDLMTAMAMGLIILGICCCAVVRPKVEEKVV